VTSHEHRGHYCIVVSTSTRCATIWTLLHLLCSSEKSPIGSKLSKTRSLGLLGRVTVVTAARSLSNKSSYVAVSCIDKSDKDLHKAICALMMRPCGRPTTPIPFHLPISVRRGVIAGLRNIRHSTAPLTSTEMLGTQLTSMPYKQSTQNYCSTKHALYHSVAYH
jgi:hypothetical protein